MIYKKHELHNMRKNENSEELIFEKHASQEVEDFFFKLAKEAYDKGFIDKQLIEQSIENKWVRKDFFNKINL